MIITKREFPNFHHYETELAGLAEHDGQQVDASHLPTRQGAD